MIAKLIRLTSRPSRRRRTLTVAAAIVAASALGTAAVVVGLAPSARASSDGSHLVPAPNSGLLRYTVAQLSTVRQVFDGLAPTPNTAWGIDQQAHQFVLTVSNQAPAAGVQKLLATARSYGDMVKVVHTPGVFSEQVLGGDQIRTSDIICSAGFNVTKGDEDYVLTAGHCTQGLPEWRDLGPSVSSNFPTTDFGLIRNESGDAPAAIDRYDGTEQPITSVGSATVGENVCAAGVTTGVTCGRVTGLDQTVDYGDGDVVNGLIQTNVHTDHGDSGGPLFAGSTGLGTVSGGDGTTDFFQPLSVSLATLGAQLVEP